MGGANSRRAHANSHRHHDTESQEISNDHDTESNYDEVDSDTIRDKHCIDTLKKDLSETPELFVLNNMLMSIMFFEDYNKVLREAAPKRYRKGETCIAPDVVLENANRNVVYRPLHGPKKFCSEPLVVKRLYVVNDAIKVVDEMDSDVELNNAPTCSHHNEQKTVILEGSPRKGFVQLREVKPPLPVSTDEDIPIARTEVTPSTSRSSTDSDTIYDYVTLKDIKTPKPIEIIKELKKPDGQFNLPDWCITYRKVKKSFADLDQDEHMAMFSAIVDEDKLFEKVSYVSSKGFMKYFQNSIFPNSLGRNLGFDAAALSLARSIPGKIFCSRIQGNASIPCEVLPSLNIQWPNSQTLEFQTKDQQPPEGKKVFLTTRMINEIKALNCVVVPKGYVKKRGEHLDGDIEWELYFPQAERYLETCMSLAQAKSFLFLLALHKTYIEPKTSELGLSSEHIRHFLLWECESNYNDWPEHRLGSKLVKVINKLNCCIAKRRLPDYFVSNKNHFENVPKKYLTQAQKVFHDVLESPLLNFIKSLRNLRYTRGSSFYPPFDFAGLYDILVKSGIESTNRQISDQVSFPIYRKKRYTDSDTMLLHILERNKRLKKIEEMLNAEKKNLDNSEERRESVDSINMDWTCEKELERDKLKKRALLKFFIDNFINISEKCAELSTHKQTKMYLKQAMYLTKILEDVSRTFDAADVQEYTTKITDLQNRYNRRAGRNGEYLQESNVHFPASTSNNIRHSRNNENALKMKSVPRKSVTFIEAQS